MPRIPSPSTFITWPILTTLTLLLALILYSPPKSSPSFHSPDPLPHPIPTPLFSDLTYFATLVAAATLHAPCAHPPFNTSEHALLNIPSTDTQATLFRDDARKRLILAFAGSNAPYDFVTNLDARLVPFSVAPDSSSGAHACRVHAGFLRAHTSAMASMHALLATARDAFPSYELHVTGGSLGAALASLACVELGRVVSGCWTFGAPRVGDLGFVRVVEEVVGERFYRVTFGVDLVPRLPPVWLGYVHPAGEIWEGVGEDGNVLGAEGAVRCFGRENGWCSVGAGRGVGWLQSARAHEGYAGYTRDVC